MTICGCVFYYGIPNNKLYSCQASCDLAVVTAHNAVLAWNWENNRCSEVACSEVNCILYPYLSPWDLMF